MRRMRRMRRPFALVVPAVLVLGCCGLLAWAAGHCGDGSCEGPETASNCPEDCGTTLDPNPLRAVVSEDVLTWRDWFEDGGFESGDAVVVELPHPRATEAATVERSALAARTGAYGLRVTASAGEGVVLGLRAEIEKGEATRCRFWARAERAPLDVRVRVLGVESGGEEPRPIYEPASPVRVDTAWTRVEFEFTNTRGVRYAFLALEVDPDTTLDLDDVAVEAEQWAAPRACRFERTVGGIRVPYRPLAPVHFNVLIHIEDPALLATREAYFREKTAVFTELARVLHEHGGFLTIQPEEDWPLAAARYAPDTLSQLAADYGVVFSTHTHGPACRDADGRLRSNQDCNACRGCPGWEPVATDTDPHTPEYVGALRELIAEVSGTQVTDHNGNFRYLNADALADAGVATWSAFKNPSTQSTFDCLFTNPWRPTACDATETPEVFFRHDPATRIIYVPGWGQAITRHPERIHERLAGMLGQVLCHADPERVNCFYVVTHVDHYGATDGEPYLQYDETRGVVVYHEAFGRDLACWEETLRELVDPLVAQGYLAWTSLPEIGELFVDWEAEVAGDV